MHVQLLQSCSTLCNPLDCSPPGSSVHGTLQARVLEWAAVPSSRGPSRPRHWTRMSSVLHVGRRALYHQCPPPLFLTRALPRGLEERQPPFDDEASRLRGTPPCCREQKGQRRLVPAQEPGQGPLPLGVVISWILTAGLKSAPDLCRLHTFGH